MEKRLKKMGASHGILIPKAILDLLKIDPKHNLIKLRVEGESLVMTKGSTYED
jgi:antitoxin component of MazEF toxin-antitoxin module